VIALSRGELALKNLQKITPKLIISDVNMPYMDGLELLKGVRKRSRFKAVPFVFLTGSASEDTEVIGLSSGADSVLHKPIKVASLKSKVRRVLDQKAEIVKESEQFFSNKVLAEQLQDDDQALMLKLEEVIMDNLKKTDLKSRDIAILLGMGEKTLRNKVKTLTGMTVKEYLRMMRMETAKKLIDQKYGTYSEIATSVGFSSLSYFRKSYKAYVNSQ
jgi:YesN/AraC family two-component response regulator